MPPHPTLASIAAPRTYEQLRERVREVLVHGQLRIDRTRLETYWQAGALIDRHLTLHENETGYGSQTMRKLARDLDGEESLLYRCLRFARAYPIFAGRQNLLWAHYRVLIEVADPTERRALELEADRNRWTAEKLEQRVRVLNAVDLAPPAEAGSAIALPAAKRLTPKRGTAGICRIVPDGDRLAVDLGFASYVRLPVTTRLTEGGFARQEADGTFAAARDATKADLFTYGAEVLKVVDGDTLWVKVFLRPDQWVKQKLRLRGLDCPEIATPEGKVAKRFVDALVLRVTAIEICTTKPDKYDRYLSDVFLTLTDGNEVYLNNALLENGHAVRKDEWEFGDWDKDLVG